MSFYYGKTEKPKNRKTEMISDLAFGVAQRDHD